jgi:nucleotide-binding universal stress UspA family protein
VGVLLEAVAGGSLLVVGRRGYGGAQRKLVGSTSMAVAARSQVPVVVAPEQWLQPSMASAPLVVGVDEHRAQNVSPDRPDPDREALLFAFDRAAQLRVPLIVVHAFEMPLLDGWSSRDVDSCRGRYEEAVQARLAPWLAAYPDVEVALRCVPGPPRQALVDAAQAAQLTVLGRHSGGHLRATLLGSTARGFLHRADHPVAVVPVPAAEDPEEVDDAGS